MFRNFIGILGGTFNPVHIGHITLALSVTEYMQLQQTQLIPCAVPPHKITKNILPFALRVQLLEAATEGLNMLSINTLERELDLPSYTWNMITYWKKFHVTYQPLFILSDEDFSILDTWYNGLELPSITNFLIVQRSKNKKTFEQTLKRFWNCTKIYPIENKSLLTYASPFNNFYCFFLKTSTIDICSSLIRHQWNNEIYLNKFVPKKVMLLLKKNIKIIKKTWN